MKKTRSFLHNLNRFAKFGLCLLTDRVENFANIENRKFSISVKTGNFQNE